MEDQGEQPPAKIFGTEEEHTVYVYREVIDMFDVRHQSYPQFNDRRLIDCVDDSQKRVNGYAPGKNEYDPPKENWQNNSFDPITRNKLKAIVASVTSTVPKTKIVATNSKNQIDQERAELISGLKKFSRMKENTHLTNITDTWNMLADGTVIKYEGYLKTKQTRRIITKYNPIEGKAEYKEKELIVDDRCIEVAVPIDQFYIKDFSISNVQDQPAVAWIRYLSESELKAEFGHHKNYKKVIENTKKKKSESVGNRFTDEKKGFYNSRWIQRTKGKRDFEVIQYYEKGNDIYRICVNGIMILDTPLLWGKSNKQYPFAKATSELYAGGTFFYGYPIGASLQFGQDIINTFWNMMVDKTLRSFGKPQVIGLSNRDFFEKEDEGYDWNTKIYVNDVNQWKEMDIQGVNQSEMAMFDMVKRETDLASVDETQQGVSGQGVTATEVRVANAKARQMSGIIFANIEDLWLQKDKLRIINILTNYTVPLVEAINGKGEEYRSFAFPDTMKDKENGIKEIQFVNSKDQIPSRKDQDAEMKKRKQGGTYTEIEIYPSDYLDDYTFDISVVPESLHAVDKAEEIADVIDLPTLLMTVNPRFWEANMDEYTKRKILPAFGESIENFTPSSPMQQLPQEAGQEGATAQNSSLPALLDANKIR